jgi:signal transduction histidine kinase
MLQHGFTAEAASAHGMLGEAHSTILRNLEQAEVHYRRSIRLARQSGNQTALGYGLFRYGCHLARNERCEQGRPYIDSCYVLFKALQDAEGIRWALNGLAFAESRCGSAIKVYDHLTAIQRVSDSLFRAETARQSARFQALYEKEKQERAIAALQVQSRQLRSYAFSAIGALVLLTAVGWLLLVRRNLRRARKAEQAMYRMKLDSFRLVLESENNERRRIASELHDSLGHLLAAARMHLSLAAATDLSTQRSAEIVDEAAREVRHISHNLMPASLKELGLVAALRQMQRNLSPGGIPVMTLQSEGYTPQSDEREMALYRMAQELLHNSIRHGKAEHIHVQLLISGKELTLAVLDDGTGFDAQQRLEHPSDSDGIGLKSLAARVEMLKGRLDIQSSPGTGCKVRLYLPV